MDLLQHYESSNDDDDDEKREEQHDDDNVPSSSSLTTPPGRPNNNNITQGGGGGGGRVTIVSESSTIFTRVVPHISGNWAGHVFVNVDSSTWPVQEAVKTFQRTLQDAGYSGPIVPHYQYHISLSRPFYLQISFIDSFVQALRERLQYQKTLTIRVMSDNRILSNEEKSRSFLVWSVQPISALLPLVQKIDQVLQQYQQPVYYQPPHFHVSIASFAGDVTHLNLEALNESFVASIKHIQCTFGTTKAFTIPLAS